ncbi:MAG: DUF448 domain-containing protein [Desulfovibrionaceae bacterium]|nr:DUF448 domain-containing protein [Desulfovibrionaceae bacterium]
MKHVPMRMCAVCRRHFPKWELHRFVPSADGESFESDAGQTAQGRGFYVCASGECLEKFRRRRPPSGRNRGGRKKNA